MSEDHHHHHHHGTATITGINKAFIIGIILNLAYVIIQVIIGLSINSLSLLSDAGHNFLDVAGLALAMLAFKLSNSKSTDKYTYGYKKASILVSLFNAVLLLISIGAIGYEALMRFENPAELPGKTIALVALIGIAINGFSAYLFFKAKEEDINIKSAFLHLASDAVVSLGLVVGGLIIYYTKIYWIDPLLSLVICAVIVASTWRLLKDSLRLSLDGVPENVDIEKVKSVISASAGVKKLFHIHIWAISTTQNALTAHLVIEENLTPKEVAQLKHSIKHELEHLNIQHSTLETASETEGFQLAEC